MQIDDLGRRIKKVARDFSVNPMGGDGLRALLGRNREDVERVASLPPPIRCSPDAPVIVAHYVSYVAESLPTYWHSVVPELESRYGDRIRYEHHDAPVISRRATAYKLATVGRAIQHETDDSAFWDWFDVLMHEGAASVEEAYELGEEVGVERETLEEAVSEDRYRHVIKHDATSYQSHRELGGPGPERLGESEREYGRRPENAALAVFVNGTQVQPTYESIAGAIERLKYGSG